MFWKGIHRLLALTALTLLINGCSSYPFKYEPYNTPQHHISDNGDSKPQEVVV